MAMPINGWHDPFTDIRESMRWGLPDWLQTPLTALTGKPYKGEVPRERTPLFHAV